MGMYLHTFIGPYLKLVAKEGHQADVEDLIETETFFFPSEVKGNVLYALPNEGSPPDSFSICQYDTDENINHEIKDIPKSIQWIKDSFPDEIKRLSEMYEISFHYGVHTWWG